MVAMVAKSVNEPSIQSSSFLMTWVYFNYYNRLSFLI